VDDFPDILKRQYHQINSDRRELLQIAYERFPRIVDCSIMGQFHWESPEGRTAVFDLYYLESAGYVDIVAQGRSFGVPPTPYAYTLTKAGIELVERPGEVERVLPLTPLTSRQRTLVLADSSHAKETVSALKKLRETIQTIPLPEGEKKDIIYHIDAILANPLLQLLFAEENPSI
jgi:hypothetical protein